MTSEITKKEAPGWPIDGGHRAWLSTFGAWWAMFITFGWVNSLGVFQSYYEQNLLQQYSSSKIAWIASVQQCLTYSAGIFLGKVFDDYGPRWLLIVGGFAQVFGLMMTSISTEYYQVFLSQAICSALGASAVMYGTVGCLATWWKVRRATAYGIAISGSSIGGIIFPIMVNRLMPRVGFGWTMRAVAFIILVGVLAAVATIRSNKAHARTPFKITSYITPMKEVKFALLCLAMTIFGFGLFLPFNFIPLEAQAMGMSWEMSIYSIVILNAVSVFGRILPGFLADKFGRFNMMMICTTMSAILTLAVWLPGRSNAASLCFSAFFGFFSGSYISLTPALVVEVSPLSEIGHRTGMLYFCISTGVLAGSPIAGALVEANDGDYTYLKVFAGVTMLIGAILIAVLRFYIHQLAKNPVAESDDGNVEIEGEKA
ncbi:putative transporter mch4 [Fusarium flagelliforme]|uniref:Putative transporter mch4 n=1 Tax=Fusarium flagelliforme TaxID=2675880 RepID=A0A395MPP3_9HYPO|nr:putative transporter mch4 [Fusarium flagelliforme]